jgi:hypothetical protein
MLRKLCFAITATLSLLISANAQEDSTKSLTVSGGLDAYYRYNFAGGNILNNNTSFTGSQSSFELGMATVRLDATALAGKVGAVVDLGFGRRAEEFSYNDGEVSTGKNGFISLSNLKQAYITYAPSSKVKFTAGKFATHVGYELVDAPLNRNYSMSYMFTNGPFFHTGLKADITAGPVGFMLGIANYTDQSTRHTISGPTTSVKTLLGQFSGSVLESKLKFYLNYVGFFGSEAGQNPSGLKSLNQVDLVLLGTISDKFNLGYNGTMQSRSQVDGSGDPDGSWIGNALYVNFDPTAKVGLTLRSEFISDSKNVYFSSNIFANTLSLNWKVGPLTIIPEFRFESAKEEIFTDSDGDPTKTTATALLAAVFKF